MVHLKYANICVLTMYFTDLQEILKKQANPRDEQQIAKIYPKIAVINRLLM